uniref:Uncharacterized protein n=1 Tax=Oryctolagus cuniculus TaxID=9986 RepID=A0A5F9DD73_RABIT
METPPRRRRGGGWLSPREKDSSLGTLDALYTLCGLFGDRQSASPRLSGRKLTERNQNSVLIDEFYLFHAPVPSSAPICLLGVLERTLRATHPRRRPRALSPPLGAGFPHLGSGDVMVFHPGGLGQPFLHLVLLLWHHQQPVLGFGAQLVLGPGGLAGIQFALGPKLALPLPLEGGRGHGLGLGRLQPRVAEDLVDVQAPVDVGLQDAVDEVLALAGQVLGAREVHAVLLLDAQHLLDVGVVVGHGAAHHDIEDDAQAPDVVDLGLVGDALQHLGGCVRCRPAEGLAEDDAPAAVPQAALGEAEVGELDVEVLVEEEVLALEVPVDDVQVVAVLDGRGELAEHLARHVLVQGPPALDELEEVALDPELHDDVDAAVRRLEDLVGLDDGAVVDGRQDVHLPRKEPLHEVGGRLLAVDDLDRHVELEALGVGRLDFGVGALAQIDAHDVTLLP